MDARRRAGFRRMLAESRDDAERGLAVIASDLAALSAARGDATADDEHDPEGVTLAEEWSRLEGIRAALEEERVQIDAALVRVDAGEYGVCAVCGADIPVARLRVRPFTDRCVRCAA